ncbi:uncharacterized protein FFM5_15126 [Fusarium fujikuroi]|nr:uncharacterized protein FFM5_15126 [Fusarium fujikuroi]
MPLRYNNAI